MEKKNTGLKVLVVILLILVLGLSSYIVYDKVLKENDNVTQDNTTNETENNIQENEDNNKLTNEEAENIVKTSYNDVVRHIFNESVAYCGEYSDDDNNSLILNGFTYRKSATFNSFEELDTYIRKYLTEKLLLTTKYNQSLTIDGSTINSYYEKDGNLYCNGWNKGGNISLTNYSEDESTFEVKTIETDSFTATINAVYYDVNNEDKTTLNINVTILKQNDNWLIDSYEVQD